MKKTELTFDNFRRLKFNNDELLIRALLCLPVQEQTVNNLISLNLKTKETLVSVFYSFPDSEHTFDNLIKLRLQNGDLLKKSYKNLPQEEQEKNKNRFAEYLKNLNLKATATLQNFDVTKSQLKSSIKSKIPYTRNRQSQPSQLPPLHPSL